MGPAAHQQNTRIAPYRSVAHQKRNASNVLDRAGRLRFHVNATCRNSQFHRPFLHDVRFRNVRANRASRHHQSRRESISKKSNPESHSIIQFWCDLSSFVRRRTIAKHHDSLVRSQRIHSSRWDGSAPRHRQEQGDSPRAHSPHSKFFHHVSQTQNRIKMTLPSSDGTPAP